MLFETLLQQHDSSLRFDAFCASGADLVDLNVVLHHTDVKDAMDEVERSQ
jgi:hypothetical protein